ncbi:hypothetical protein QTP88_021740 [Uroleucon formosanum]
MKETTVVWAKLFLILIISAKPLGLKADLKECKRLGNNSCRNHTECCSGFCFMEPGWESGVCKILKGPENPNKSIPENPNESIFDNPNKSIPENPNESIFDNPNKSIPENPNESIFDNPNKSIPENPNESIFDNPNKSIPENSNESIPDNNQYKSNSNSYEESNEQNNRGHDEVDDVFEKGTCAYYKGHSTTANGDIYDEHEMTAAHGTLPFNTMVKVETMGTYVVVKINDRKPRMDGQVLLLSRAAAQNLYINENTGPVPCQLKILTSLSCIISFGDPCVMHYECCSYYCLREMFSTQGVCVPR